MEKEGPGKQENVLDQVWKDYQGSIKNCPGNDSWAGYM
jgi:hypothetical protein